MEQGQEDKMVSVVIPTYNRADLLLRAVESVLTQTYTDVEAIVVDDGSTDSTSSVIEKLQRAYGLRLKYFYQPNRGVSAARNKGIYYASGEYISFLDSDDYIYPKKIEQQIAFLKEHAADVCFCNYYIIGKKRRKKGLRGHVENLLLRYMQSRMTPQTNAWIIRKEVLDKADISFREGCSWGEDMEFFIKVMHAADKVVFLDEPLFEYYKNETGLSKFSWDKLEQDVFIWTEIWRWLEKHIADKDLLQTYKDVIFGYRIPLLLVYRLWAGRRMSVEAREYAALYRPYLKQINCSNGLRSLKLLIVWGLFRLKMICTKQTNW